MAERLGQDSDVVPSLMDVLREAVEDASIPERRIAVRMEDIGAEPAEKRTIERWLDRENFPPGARIGEFVRAVALEKTGEEAGQFGFWRLALKRAEDAAKADPPIDKPQLESETLWRAGDSPQSAEPRTRKRSGK